MPYHHRKERDSDFGSHVRRLRKQRGWTQEHLAEVAGIARDTVKRIERHGQFPRWPTLQRLARAFDMNVPELMSEDKTKEEAVVS